MKALRRALLAMAAALLVVQPALACLCAEDLLAHAGETAVEEPSCHEVLQTGHTDFPQGESPRCADCGDYQPAPALEAVKALAANHLPEFKALPAVADRPAVPVRPRTLRSIRPAPTVPRAAHTPVLLKQRLLI